MDDWTLTWDTLEITQAQAEFLQESEGLGEQEAFDSACEDPDLLDLEWDDLCENLTAEMKRLNPGGVWTATVDNFGWMHQSGCMPEKRLETGQQLLQAVLPNTPCTFTIRQETFGQGRNSMGRFTPNRVGFCINNAHHDAPMGGEIYNIIPVLEE